MPAAKATRQRNKRTLSEVDPNASEHHPDAEQTGSKQVTKKQKSTTQKTTNNENLMSKDASQTKNATNASAAPDKSNDSLRKAIENAKSVSEIPPRIRHGPNGELFIPWAIPVEGMEAMQKAMLCSPSMTQIDGIPGRSMTSGNEKWWAESREWLKKHAKELKFNEETWRKKAADSLKSAKMSAKDKKDDEKADQKELNRQKLLGREDFDWVCTCRPEWDIDAERGGNSDDEDDDEDRPHSCGNDCKSNQLASHHPGWSWIMTLRGSDRLHFWMQEMGKRDQDDFDMYVYNDFTGYGIREVIENQLLAFDKAFKHGEKDLLALWAELEGMAFFLNRDIGPFAMIDDSEGNAALITTIGHAILNTIALLIKKNEFKPDSSIKNLGLILAMLVRFAENFDDDDECDETGWNRNVVALSDKHHVHLDMLHGFDEKLEEIREDIDQAASDEEASGGDEDDSQADDEAQGRFGKPTSTGEPWAQALKDYTEKHGVQKGKKPQIGGTNYDITQFSAAKKKKHDLSNQGGMMF